MKTVQANYSSYSMAEIQGDCAALNITLSEVFNSNIVSFGALQENVSSDTKVNTSGEVSNQTESDTQISATDTRIQSPGYVTASDPSHLINFATWNQSSPYNIYCPIDPISEERCVVGCTATATAQILYFWKHSTAISFSAADEYVSENTPKNSKTRTIRIDQDAATRSFPNFTTLNGYLSNLKYNFSNEEKAAMSFAAGIMTKMEYSSVESGAYANKVAPALKNKCGYASAGDAYILRDAQRKITQSTIEVFADNIAQGRPIFAATSGHAVVIDGYNSSTKLFHVNLGWGGSSDDWYTLDSIADQGQLESATIDIAPSMASYAKYYVTTTDDYGVGSLRRAIEQANNNKGKDTIFFDSKLTGQTITLTTGTINISDTCIIDGLGAGNISISGGWYGGSATVGSQIFSIVNGGNGKDSDFEISISNLTLTDGFSTDKGGAIFNSGILSLTNVTVTNCGAQNAGGGIYSKGSLTLSNTVVSNNQSSGGNGGGINVIGSLTINDSIITGNSTGMINGAVEGSGGIANLAAAKGILSYDTLVKLNTPNNLLGGFTDSGVTKFFTGDFNGDKADEVLRWQQEQRSVAWVGAKSSGNWTNVSALDPSAWQVLGAGDFNGDGTSDILIFNKEYKSMGTWLMKDGAVSSWSSICSLDRTTWNFAGVGDFNGDGTSDILVSNNSGQIGAWLIKDGTFSSWSSIGNLNPSQWTIAGIGDFNGDKTSDVLLANKTNQITGAWMLNNGEFSSWSNIGNIDFNQWSIPTIGDINGDGISDILLQHNNDGNYLGGWLMNKQAQMASWTGIGSIDLKSWQAPATGSFQGNGTSDILLCSTNSDVVGEWKMKNGAYDGWVTLATA